MAGIRWSFQNTNHLWSQYVEYHNNYYPNYCELNQIVNLTITGCDPLDGKTDGVVSRTDLCRTQFNISSAIGAPYSCAETAEIPGLKLYIPAANRTVSDQAAAVTNCTSADQSSCSAYLDLMGAEWIPQGIELVANTSLTNFDNVTDDTFRDWMP